MALPGRAPAFGDHATKISEYMQGVGFTANGQRVVGALQWNAVNRRWARRGTVPFYGDYIDIATMPYLPPDEAAGRRSWTPNNQLERDTPLGRAPVMPNVLIAWTDNRDMRTAPGADSIPEGHNPGNPAGNDPPDPNSPQPAPVPYVVPAGLNLPPGSIADPTQTRMECTPGNSYQTGTTNQNAYAARVTVGVLAGSPGNNKELGALQRAFVVFVRNDTTAGKAFRLLASQPPGGIASFHQFDGSRTITDIVVPGRSSVSRTVYVSQDPASTTILDPDALVRVDVIEVVGIVPVQVTSVFLNGDASAPEIESPEIESRELFAPEIESPEIESFLTPAPEIESPEIESPEIESPEIESLGLQTPEIESGELSGPEIESPEIESPEIESASISDITFEVTNTGNTTGQYNARTFVTAPAGSDFRYQVIVRRRYEVPVVGPDCLLKTLEVSKVDVNITDVALGAPEIESPEIESSAPGTASFFIAPGDSRDVIIRARSASGARLPAQAADILVQQEAVDSDDAAAGITEPPVVATYLLVATSALPTGAVGQPYAATLGSTGSVGSLTWSLVSGGLPDGLSLSPTGAITGTPSTTGTFPFTVSAADSSLPPQTATRLLSISVLAPGVATLVFVTQPSDTAVNQIIRPAVSVRAFSAGGGPVAGAIVSLQLLGSPTARLLGTLSRPTGPTGVATFPDLSVNESLSGLTLRATALGFSSTNSIAFSTGPVIGEPVAGTLVDAAGDVAANFLSDIVRAGVVVQGGNITLSVRFTPTFGPDSATQFTLDTDQNPATGHQGSDAGCTNDNGVIGSEFIVDLGPGSDASVLLGGDGTQAGIRPFVGPGCNTFGGSVLTASGSVTNVFDDSEVLIGMDVTFPLSLIGGDDGRLNFKVLSYNHLTGNSFTGVLDRVSEIGQPPGQVR